MTRTEAKRLKLDPSQICKKDRHTGERLCPLPRGAELDIKRREPDPEELAKYERTMAFGGLVPERSPILDRLCRMLGPEISEK